MLAAVMKAQGALGDASFHGSGRLILYIRPAVGPNWQRI
jgi:hypothetical protein